MQQWLESLGLGEYAAVFAENAVDFRALPTLTENDLTEPGLKLGHRRVLQQAIAAMACGTDGAVPARAAPRGGAERRQLTVMFCDLVGSTSLSAHMDPERYRDLLAAYQDAAREAIGRYGGYIARYMGDGLLVYFGYPQAHEDDAERAVRAGLAVVDAMAALRLEGVARLQVRIGIATGLVVAGDIVGEGSTEEHAVLGETPDLAAGDRRARQRRHGTHRGAAPAPLIPVTRPVHRP